MPAHLLPASASLEMPPICHRPATAHNNLHCYYLCLQQHDPHGPHCHLLIKTFKLYRNIVRREARIRFSCPIAMGYFRYYLLSIIYYLLLQPSAFLPPRPSPTRRMILHHIIPRATYPQLLSIVKDRLCVLYSCRLTTWRVSCAVAVISRVG